MVPPQLPVVASTSYAVALETDVHCSTTEVVPAVSDVPVVGAERLGAGGGVGGGGGGGGPLLAPPPPQEAQNTNARISIGFSTR